MTSHWMAATAAISLAAGLTGCGGGGGGGSAPIAKDTSASLVTAPAGFGFANFKSVTRTGQQLLDGVGGFATSNPRHTYVRIWYVDPAGGRQQLAFVSLAGLQALSAAGGLTVAVPGGVRSVRYEIYDATASKSGEISA